MQRTAPTVPKFTKPSVPKLSAPSLPSFGVAPAPAPKAKPAPKLPKVSLPKVPKAQAKAAPLPKTAKFGSLVDRKTKYNPAGPDIGRASSQLPVYLEGKGEKSGGGVGAAVPLVLAAGAAAVVVGAVTTLSGAGDGVVEVKVPTDPVAVASKVAAGSPLKARLSGLPLLPAQDVSVSVSVSPAAGPADIVIDAKGGIGAGLNILSGSVKTKVNGAPLDAAIGLSQGEAAVNIKSAVIPALKLPLKPATTTDWEQVVKLSDGTISYRNAKTGQTASELPSSQKALFGVRPCFVTSFNGCSE